LRYVANRQTGIQTTTITLAEVTNRSVWAFGHNTPTSQTDTRPVNELTRYDGRRKLFTMYPRCHSPACSSSVTVFINFKQHFHLFIKKLASWTVYHSKHVVAPCRENTECASTR